MQTQHTTFAHNNVSISPHTNMLLLSWYYVY